MWWTALCVLLAAAAVKADLVIVDDQGTLPVCYDATGIVNISGIDAPDRNLAQAIAGSSRIVYEDVKEKAPFPSQLAYILDNPGGSLYPVTITRLSGTGNISISTSIRIGIQNLTDDRSVTFISCDPDLCSFMNWPSQECTGLAYNNGSGANSCGPIMSSLQLGSVSIGNSNGTKGLLFRSSTPNVPRPYVDWNSCINRGRQCDHSGSINNQGLFFNFASACDGGEYMSSEAHIIDQYCDGSGFHVPDWLLQYVYLGDPDPDSFISPVCTELCFINGTWFTYGYENWFPYHATTTATYAGGIKQIMPISGCPSCEFFSFFGFDTYDSCAEIRCQTKVIHHRTSGYNCSNELESSPQATIMMSLCHDGVLDLVIQTEDSNVQLGGYWFNLTEATHVYRGVRTMDSRQQRPRAIFVTNANFFLTTSFGIEQIYSSMMGASQFAFPHSFPRVITWKNYTCEWNTTIVSERLMGAFDFIGDIASDLFGLATEDDIEDMVKAAEAALKASKESLLITRELIKEVATIMNVMQNVVDQFNDKIIDLAYTIDELRYADLESAAITEANFRSMRSYVIANVVKQSLGNQAIWSQIFNNVVSELSSTEVTMNDPFAELVMQRIQSMSVEAGYGVVGGSGPGLHVLPMMKKQMLRAREGSYILYSVPVCKNFTLQVHTVQKLTTPMSYSGTVYSSVVPGQLDGIGSCIGGPAGMFPSLDYITSGNSRFISDHGSTNAQTGTSIDECVATLAQAPVTWLGTMSSQGNASRSLYRTIEPSGVSWVNKSTPFVFLKFGPCQYNLVSDPEKEITYHRFGMSLVRAKGNDLILLKEGDSVEVTSADNIPGLPFSISCRPGEQIASVMQGSFPGWITNMVKTDPLDTIVYPAEIMTPELPFRNATNKRLIDISADVSNSMTRLDDLTDRTNKAIADIENAQAELEGRSSCNMWTFKGCSTLQQAMIALLYILFGCFGLYLIAMLLSSTVSSGHGASRSSSFKMSSLSVMLIFALAAEGVIVGEANFTNTTTTTTVPTTTVLNITTTTSTVANTTTTTPATTTADETCGRYDASIYGKGMIVWQSSDACCVGPRNVCNPVDLTGGCSWDEILYAVMFWMSMIAVAVYILRTVFKGGREHAKWASEKAMDEVISGIRKEWTNVDSPSYQFYCSSAVCKGDTFLAQKRLFKVREVLDDEVIAVAPAQCKADDFTCSKCGTLWWTQSEFYEGEGFMCTLRSEIALKMPVQEGSTKTHVVLLQSAYNKLKFGGSVISRAEATAYGLGDENNKKRLPVRSILKVGTGLLYASMLPSASAEIWRKGCEPADYGNVCCRPSEVTGYFVLWILIAGIGFSVLLNFGYIWILVSKIARNTKRMVVRQLATKMSKAGKAALELGILASMASSAEASPQLNVQWIDDGDCKWSDFGSCSAGHKFVFVVVTLISFIFSIGLMMVLWRLIGCLKAVTKCLSWRTKAQERNGEMAKAAEKLVTILAESLSGRK